MAYLTITAAKQELGWLELNAVLTVGRQPECEISFPDDLMSRRHCRFEFDDEADAWTVVDLGSKNGTWRAGHAIERLKLEPGMQVRAGRTTITYHAGAPPIEGQFCKKRVVRPTDPHEALASTVMGMRVVEAESDRPKRPSDPWVAGSIRSAPRPMPRALEPREAEAATALLEAPTNLSGAREVEGSSRARLRPLPRPVLLEIPPSPPDLLQLVERPVMHEPLVQIADPTAPEVASAPRAIAAPPVPAYIARRRRLRRLAFNLAMLLLWAASVAGFAVMARLE